MKRPIGVGELLVSDDPDDVLVTFALGPCLGVAVWDAVARVAGLIHCQLPLGRDDPRAAAQPALYVDTGVLALFDRMMALGAAKQRFEITVAGGARLLSDHTLFRVGERNYTVLRKLLWKNNLLIRAAEVGGDQPRTMYCAVADGKVTLQSAGRVWQPGAGPDEVGRGT